MMPSIFFDAAWISVRIIGAGWWWTRVDQPFFLRAVKALVLGVMLNLLPVVVLAPAGLWTPLVDGLVWFGILGIRLLLLGPGHPGPWRQFLAAWGFLMLLNVGILLSPVRSEWLAGGWDPGIYQNNAISVANHDGIQPRLNPFYARLTAEERITLSRGTDSYREIFPSVPIQIENGSMPVYSFHLTSMMGAWLYRSGGTPALVRMPAFLAWWWLPVLAALLYQLGWRGWRAGLPVLAALISPIWWYHQAIPTAEMLYLFLFTSSMWFYRQAAMEMSRIPFAAGIILCMATINHFNFPVVAGLFFFVIALLGPCERHEASRLFFFMFAITLGIIYDIVLSGITIQRLQEKDLVLPWVLIPFAALFVMAITLAFWHRSTAIRLHMRQVASMALSLAGLATALVAIAISVAMTHAPWLDYIGRLPLIGDVAIRFSRIQLFTGLVAMVAAGTGLFFYFRRSRQEGAVFLLALGVVFLSFLFNPGIAEIYPWGLRRYVPVLLILMVAGQAALIMSLLEFKTPKAGSMKAGFLLLALCIVSLMARNVGSAMRVGDYAGMEKMMKTISDSVGERDLVVADDPAWGTPLLMLYGHAVVNGKLLWNNQDSDYRRRFLNILQRMESDHGYRVLWLTSTDRGASLYPELSGRVDMLKMFDPFYFQTIIHSARADHFATRKEQRIFRLYANHAEGIRQ